MTDKKHQNDCEKNQLHAANQQLKALNQQLTAAEQQLRAMNQQLKKEHKELSERKAELRNQYTILRTLIDNVPDLIYIKDTDSRFIIANSAAAKHMGAKNSQDLIGKTDHDFYPENYANEYLADELKVFKSGKKLINLEEYSVNKDGKRLWFSSSKIPLKNDDGQTIGLVGISRNITGRKEFEQQLIELNNNLQTHQQQLKAVNQQLRAHEQQLKAANQHLKADEQQLKAANQQLRASEQQLKAANQQLNAHQQQLRAVNQQLLSAEKELVALAKFPEENPNPVFRINQNGTVIYKNQKAELLLSSWQSKSGKLTKKWIDFTQQVLLKGSPRYLEYEQNGMFYAMTFAPILEEGYVNIYGHDISQRKEMERLLQEYNDKLEQRVKERTAQLEQANEKLRQEAVERRKVEEKIMDYQVKLRSMAAQLSLSEERQRKNLAETLHDDAIQTLVFLKMKINDLQQQNTEDVFAKVLAQLDQQTSELIQRMRTLTFDLSSPILYDLGLAAAINDLLTREIGEKHGIATSFHDDKSTKEIHNDLKALLFRAVKELLANSAKHAKAKNIKVSKMSKNENIVIIVEDDGIGFDTVKKEFKFDATTGGFGLFTINERLSLYNGSMNIDSAPGKGTKVTLTVPLTI